MPSHGVRVQGARHARAVVFAAAASHPPHFGEGSGPGTAEHLCLQTPGGVGCLKLLPLLRQTVRVDGACLALSLRVLRVSCSVCTPFSAASLCLALYRGLSSRARVKECPMCPRIRAKEQRDGRSASSLVPSDLAAIVCVCAQTGRSQMELGTQGGLRLFRAPPASPGEGLAKGRCGDARTRPASASRSVRHDMRLSRSFPRRLHFRG